jgi:hypothetical protein
MLFMRHILSFLHRPEEVSVFHGIVWKDKDHWDVHVKFLKNGFCTYTRICMVFLSSYFYFLRFTLTMVDEKIHFSHIFLSESKSRTNGDGNIHTHACKYKSCFFGIFDNCDSLFFFFFKKKLKARSVSAVWSVMIFVRSSVLSCFRNASLSRWTCQVRNLLELDQASLTKKPQSHSDPAG